MGAVDTTYTFTATDTITSTKMNNIIDQTKITTEAIDGPSLEIVSPGKIRVKAQGISSNELASNSVTTSKIANSTSTTTGVTTAKIADLSVTSEKLANNSITGIKLANSTIEASKLNSGQTGTAPIIAARATLQMKKGFLQNSTSSYSSISVAMSLVSGSPSTVTVTSATDHGFLVGEPFFIWMENPNTSLSDWYFCGFVNEVVSVTQFKFLTTASTLPSSASQSIYFIDPTKYNSINIKRVSPGTAVAQSNYISAASSFVLFISNNELFNAAFNTPLSSADNGVIIGSDNPSVGEVGLKYFNFYSPDTGLIDMNPNYYNRSFSVAVFA